MMKEMEQAISDGRREMKQLVEIITQHKDTPENRRGAYQRREPAPNDVCYRCKQKGHFARNCKRPAGSKSGNESQLTPRLGGKLADEQSQEEKTEREVRNPPK